MIIIDGNSVAARCFFGTHYNVSIFNSKLFIEAYLKSLLKIFTDLADFDNQLMLCIDSLSWRKILYPDYKENRNILKGKYPYGSYIDYYHDVCADMKMNLPIRIVKKECYEADDLLAYYSRECKTSISVSTDSDIKQLIDPPKIQMWDHSKEEFISVKDKRLLLLIQVITGQNKKDNIPSIVPRGQNGKPKFRLGEKTIEKNYDWSEDGDKNMNIDSNFWDEKKKRKNLSEDEFKKMKFDYKTNKKLIDLNLSPVYKEDLPLNFQIGEYDPKSVDEFFGKYIYTDYWNERDRIQFLLKHYWN